MATAVVDTARGFKAPCLRCGERYSVSVTLHDVRAFTCSSCENDWTAADAREAMEQWLLVLNWIETAPILEE